MIHSLYILLSIARTSFSKLPIYQLHLCLFSPRDETEHGPPPLAKGGEG